MKNFKIQSTTLRKYLPWFLIALTLALAALLLHAQGRLWMCACGKVYLWVGDIWSSDNSQHIFDPYTFTHILHGLVACGLLAWIFPRLPVSWRLWLAILLESTWEVVENSEFIIQRYRDTTVSLGYTGDTVINSLADIFACGVGFFVARRLGWRWSLALFILTEAILLLWIRDSWIANLVMLIAPQKDFKAWQMGL